jgi:phage/plasmid primase-like uncharacterized protein
MNDPHHDHQHANMKVATQPTRIRRYCHHCLIMGGRHSLSCPVRNGAGEWHEVDGVAVGDFRDGRYLVETVTRQFVAVYLNNDEEQVYLTFDDDTREIDPRMIVRIARIVEV